MFKTIVRLVSIALIFLAVCWIAGSSWYQFKHDVDLKSPLDVFHINTPSLEEPDINTPKIPEVEAEDKNKEDTKKEETKKEEVKQDESKKENNTQNTDKKVDSKKSEPQLDKDELNSLISKIRVSSESQKSKYDRDNYEKPTHSFKYNGQRLTRNKYAWHVSKFLKSEEPFSYDCPYTHLDITDMSTLDFEHIIPLNYIHKYGDTKWTNDEMNQYAYDMLIGMDVLNKANRSHSDKGPSEWLPEQNISSYCLTWLTIAYEYDIALRSVDIQICKLEILNDLDNATLINQFNKNTEEYQNQQKWVKDIGLDD